MKLKNEQTALAPLDIVSINEESEHLKTEESRLLTSMNLLLANCHPEVVKNGFSKAMTQSIMNKIDKLINDQVNEIIHHQDFKDVEAAWLGINDLVQNTEFKSNIKIDLLDASKEEMADDLECNSVDITGSELFKKLYFREYDQFGGEPYGSIISLYEFENTPEDIDFLSTAGKIGTAAHSPFIGSASPQFFGLKNIAEIENISDLEGMMSHPKYGRWNKLRNTEQATYIGLTLPRYIVRTPWDPEITPAGKSFRSFKEEIDPLNDDHYTWANASMLFARNLTRSFATSGWCQYIRGPKGGGLLEGLPVHTFNVRGKEEIKPPVECVLPDNKELSFARCGFIPLIYEKNTANACFFSTQSLKQPKKFVDPKDSEDSQMVANLAYTYSVCRIAHYIKIIGRLNIGSSADAAYLQNILTKWISGYITILTNPDDLTLKYFPFKAAEIKVVPQPGELGWYKCTFSVLPHIQFEGMDVALQLTTRLEK